MEAVAQTTHGSGGRSVVGRPMLAAAKDNRQRGLNARQSDNATRRPTTSASAKCRERADRKEARLDRYAPFTAAEVARDDGICRAARHSGRAVYACAA